MKYILNFITNIKYLFIIDNPVENLFVLRLQMRGIIKTYEAQVKAMQQRIDDIEDWAEHDLDAQIKTKYINDLIMRLKGER